MAAKKVIHVSYGFADEVKEAALSMSFQGLSDSDICKFTEISERTLKRLLSIFSYYIYLNSTTFCLCPNLYDCNECSHAILVIYQSIGSAASQHAEQSRTMDGVE